MPPTPSPPPAAGPAPTGPLGRLPAPVVLLLALLPLAFLWMFSAPLGAAFDPRALLLAVGLPAALTVALHGAAAPLRAARAALGAPPDAAAVSTHLAVFATARRAALAGGGIGLAIGLVGVLGSAPDAAALPGALASATTTLMWALVVGELLVGTLGRRLGRGAEPGLALPGPLPAAGLAGLGLALWLPMALPSAPLPPAATAPTSSASAQDGAFTRRPGHGGTTAFSLAPFEIGLRSDPNALDTAGTASFSISIEVQDADADALEELLHARGPVIREAILLLATDFTPDELRTSDGLLILKDAARHRVELIAPELSLVGVLLHDLTVRPPPAPAAGGTP